MKTTIELSDELVMEAKKLAIERRTTLRALVEQGLRHELGMPAEPASHPLERIATLDAEIWKGVKADRYVAGERADWE
jgi:predicted transcriptional regulator